MNQGRDCAQRTPTARAIWPTICVLLTLWATSGAWAETVYRCGPDLNRYGTTPCEDGRSIEVSDARSAEQLRQGHEAAHHQAKAERDLARELRDQEHRPISAVSLSARKAEAHERKASQTPAQKTHKKRRDGQATPDTFKAIDPDSVPKKRRAQSGRRSNQPA